MINYKSGLLAFVFAIGFSITLIAQEKTITQPPTTTLTDTSVNEEVKDNILDNIPIVSLDENDDQDGSAQNISGQLNSGRNPYVSAASFNFNVVRFRIRGYDADLFSTNMNGVSMENLDNGFTPYGLWGGLNDVMRSRTNAYGLQSNKFTFGSIGGATNLDTRASKQWKQTKIGYSLSNRNYVHRFNFTKSTGFNSKGWAFSFSGSRRWADEGFTDGTFYDGWSAYVGIDKKINERHLLSFVAFATPTKNGRQGSSVQEMLNIAGTNFYNPYWGYQNGVKRNSSVGSTFQPIGILTHEWKINPKTTLTTAASYMFGDRSTTGLDWYNAPDPRPDYYKYLPSYQDDPLIRQQVYDALKNNDNNRQINWDKLYTSNYGNYQTVHNANGVLGNDFSGKRSLYIIEERVTHTNKFNFNTTLNATINTHIDFSAGLSYENQKNNYYKKVNDLLGGDFYMDLNQFAERDFPSNPFAGQNDVNNPNKIVKAGDKVGYNYDIYIQKATGWAQANVKLRGLDFFVGAENSYTNFWRVGNVKSGLFLDNSYGKSAEHEFYNYAAKAGLSYKVAKMNYLFLNGRYETKAPFFDNAYLAPRTRDFVQDDLRSEHISSIEGGYALIAPTVKFRATAYYTLFDHQTNVLTFYNDQLRSVVNYALSNIGKEHKGIELGTEVIVYKGLTVNAAAGIGKFTYNTRQLATVTSDNSSSVIAKDQVIYSKNYNVPTPQQAYNIGLNYRSPKYWYVNVNYNYFDDMWLDFNPVRRTEAAVNGVDPSSQLWHRILDQTKLAPQSTVDLFAGYSWLMNTRFKSLSKRTFLLFNVGVNNLLNNTSIVSGGYEQLRFDYAEKNVDKFPAKQFFAYGTNFQASIALRF